ncbi:branched-chain amino acid ABC transporter permease, partial [Halorubrum sp. SS7]
MSLLDDPKAAFADLTRPEWWVLGVSVAFLLFLFVAMLTGGLS